MRRSRRGGGSHAEFASSGEDSFVAVVVTKLTGALLFILLLTMVIMALLPKAVDLGQTAKPADSAPAASEGASTLRIATPTTLPDAVAGRPYLLALAATGGHGPLRWSAREPLPAWLTLDESTGRLGGMPPGPTEQAISLDLEVSDTTATASQPARLEVLPQRQAPSMALAWRRLRWIAAPGQAWLEHGVGFLVLWLVHLLGMNLLGNMERESREAAGALEISDDAQYAVAKRFKSYRLALRIATLAAMIALGAWLAWPSSSTPS